MSNKVPHLWLNEGQEVDTAECDCRLWSADVEETGVSGAAFFFCPMHAAAQGLLDAAEAMERADMGIGPEGRNAAWDKLGVAIAAARVKS
jgi:hypothetical protein